MKNNKNIDNNKEDIYKISSYSDVNKTILLFSSSIDGLDEEEIIESRKKYGENIISQEKKEFILYKLAKAFFTPFTIVLLILAFISFSTDFLFAKENKDLTAFIIILSMVTLSSCMTLFQSIRSSKAIEKLTSMVRVTATVLRKNEGKKEISIEEIVCGDIIYLSAGDMIPADIRLIQTKDLFISQSTMTGESNPVEKISTKQTDSNTSITDYQNIAYMGSNVISGSAKGIVISVGNNTFFGKIAKGISEKKGKTSFEMGISSVSWILIRFMIIMVLSIFIINGFTKGNWTEAFLFGLSVAVGLTPEMLPMIVTTNLVKGALSMSKKGTIIKNINSIQNFGAIDILCTDKTGTLTQDKIVLEYNLDVKGKEDNRVLKHAFLNSYYQTGLKNLMDVSIIEVAKEELDISKYNYEKIDEIPFDFHRRRMSVVIKDKQGKTQIITKGAVEEMISISKFVDYEGKIIELTEEIKQTILKTVNDLNEDGLRVIAVSQKTNPKVAGEFSIADESDMVLIGYLAFLDPPKETTKPALEALKRNGVAVKVLTGDNALVTKAVCKQVGLKNEEVILGNILENLNDEDLLKIIEEKNIFVKLSPQQKTRIIKLLRKNGHIVGFMGDGINDASAMKESDIGISVDTAVDISKESADIILLEKDLMVLEQGIVSGRKVFGNIIKYLKMTASSNFGNMFSVVFASLFLPFLPMLPIQILFLNLIYDISCISIPWDNMDKDYLQKPRKWNSSSISTFMKWFGPISSIFDITTYLFMYFIICPKIVGGNYNTLDENHKLLFISLFHSGWFVESFLTQITVIHTLRTSKIPFVQSIASFVLIVVTSIAAIIITLLPYTKLGFKLGMIGLPLNYFGWLFITIISYFIFVTFIKKIYISKYKELL